MSEELRVVEDMVNKTAIVVHFYYMDQLDKLVEYLDELRKHISFDVLVTTPHTDKDKLESISGRLKAVYIECMENKGRDVLPFLRILPKLQCYDFVCKIHTKRLGVSFYEDSCFYHWVGDEYYHGKERKKNDRIAFFHWSIGAELGNNQCIENLKWAYTEGIGCVADKSKIPFLPKPIISCARDMMWDNLILPSSAMTALSELRKGEVMYAPKELWRIDIQNISNVNYENIKRLGTFLGIHMISTAHIFGTMFWFKPEALMWLTDFDFDCLFDEEEGADDGKMEHAFERYFSCFACFGKMIKNNK
jgi:hypothetical protein